MKKKIALAYSGSLIDTLIIKWIQINTKMNIYILLFNLNKKDNISIVKNKIIKLGVKNIFIINKENIFIKKYIFSLLKNNFSENKIYFYVNLLLEFFIIKELIKICFFFKIKYIFFNNYNNLKINFFNSKIKILNFYNFLNLNSKKKFLNFCFINHLKINNFYLNNNYKKNIFYLNKYVYYPLYLSLTFKNGIPIKINNKKYNFINLLIKLNNIGIISGIKTDSYLNYNYFSIKILLFVKKYLEIFILNKNILNIKNKISKEYLLLIEKKNWWSNDRLFFQNIINLTQKFINGIIKIKIYNGNVFIIKKIINNVFYYKNNKNYLKLNFIELINKKNINFFI
ncbi:argininosuccinate synthase [Candidatus Carsonella ruddii CS isolate Thao2000]|uniref:argininosuccinate synthase n=1 Tax=Candidatus Carsonella ruddii CS isolate Thao2000 TaxID=1202537 RepID=J7H0E7_CARRU|nr:argininosuccinate synthase domain-containing protein [Candidatus Carsonella ruddii]AFP83780.1 argininosuccinate synthase [Candidatus Carsonella ruddii CS isolate Thao2000]